MIDPKDYPSIDFQIPGWQVDQVFCDGDDAWDVKDIWAAAKDLPVHEIPLVGMNVDIQPWDSVGDDFLEFCKHAALVNKADLRYPIILTPAGVIADGRHRIAKAMIQGKTTIKVQRLRFMPEANYTFTPDGDLTDK
jgi:hypothetical protein